MPKSYIEKRLKFLSKNKQKAFFELVQQKMKVNTKELALIGKVSTRQISDWKSAQSTLTLDAFEKILTLSKIPRPRNIKIVDRYAHTKSAGKKGFITVLKKYGEFPKNEERRKESWQKWWNSKGIHKKQKILKRIPIKIPKKSTELAELCGILIGDGGVTKWQVKITLNRETDKKYAKFVARLLEKLFDTKPKIYKIKNSKALDICISRRDLVDFLHKQGIIIGKKLKQNISIPKWIMKSRKYMIPCIRGMVDTDGCIVVETHRIKGKEYLYHRLNFTSASPTLVGQTVWILEKLGFHPKIRRDGKSVQLENTKEICEYFERVGTSNPKHLNRLRRSGSRGLRHRS